MIQLRSFGATQWMKVRDGDPFAKELYDRHYSARRYADGRNPAKIVGPGEYLMLVTPDYQALFVWRKFISVDHQEGVNCSIFRNEGNLLSSELILDAERWAWARWPAEHRLYTYVNPCKVASRNPGYCFKCTGWQGCGLTKINKLLVLEKYR